LDQKLTKVLLGEPGLTYQLMGECFLAADKPQDALAVFEKADKVAPDKALRQFNLARVCAKTGKPAEALAALEASFAEHLTDQGMAPYETLAELLGTLGKKAELLERLEKLRQSDPNGIPLAYYLASQYRAAGQLDKAESLYLELLKSKPTLTGYRALIDLAKQTKRFDLLLSVLGDALEKTSVLDLLGVEAQAISGDPESVQRLVEAARNEMKTDPAKFGYGRRLLVALLTLEAKQYETASEFFNLALAVKPSAPVQPAKPPKSDDKGSAERAGGTEVAASQAASTSRVAEVLMVWGIGLLTGDRPAEAARVFQRGIDEKALPDNNPAFSFYLAGALAMAQRPDEALAAARVAAEKNKDSARFRGRVAWVLYIAKRYEEAKKAYQKLIEEFDADHASAESREVLREVRLALSNLAIIQGDMPQAEEWLEQVLDEFPDDESALNDLGYLWADRGKNLERAERMIRKAVAAEPDNMAYRDSLGWVLFRLGKCAEARTELEKAAAIKKPDGVVLDHLGDVYQKLNQHDKAIETWRKAADILRQEKELDKAAAVEKKVKAN
jgi:tetratricopeptide (TPR) repeat protein